MKTVHVSSESWNCLFSLSKAFENQRLIMNDIHCIYHTILSVLRKKSKKPAEWHVTLTFLRAQKAALFFNIWCCILWEYCSITEMSAYIIVLTQVLNLSTSNNQITCFCNGQSQRNKIWSFEKWPIRADRTYAIVDTQIVKGHLTALFTFDVFMLKFNGLPFPAEGLPVFWSFKSETEEINCC